MAKIKPGDKLPSGLYWRGTVIWVRVQQAGGDLRASSHGDSVAAAQQLLAKLKTDIAIRKHDHAMGRKPTPPTLGALIERYLCEWAGQASERDSVRYAEEWKAWLGSFKADQVRAGDIERTLAQQAQKREKPWSSASFNRRRAFLSALYQKAIRDEVLDRNPAVAVRRKEEVARDRYLTPAELDRLRVALGPHQVAIILFAILSGLRAGAMLRIKVADVDLGQGVVRVEAVAGRKKVARLVALSSEAVEVVGQLLTDAEAAKSDWLFPGRYRGSVMSPKSLHQLLQRACKRAEVPPLRWHDLRHTCGSWLAQTGAPSTVVKEILGHQTMDMVARYATTVTAHRREFLDRLGPLVKPTGAKDRTENRAGTKPATGNKDTAENGSTKPMEKN